MPTIVTEIVNNMFRSQRNKRGFAKKLREMSSDGATSESATSESENEASDVECLDTSKVAQLTANQPSEEYFLWGAELSRSRDIHKLKLDEDINEDEERHLLLLKQVCLGVNAKEGERNVIEIHTTDFSDKEQRHPIASLTLGKKEFANLDLCLSWSKTKEIKLKLVMGSGPITITGNHFVEYLALPEDNDPEYVPEETDDETELSTFEDTEDTVDENELKDLAEEGATAAGGEGKRKRTASPSEPTMKKRKSDSDDVNVKEVDLKA